MNKRGFFLPDLLTTIPSLLLLSFGILVISSSDSKLAIQQVIFAVVGLVVYWVFSTLNFEFFGQYAKYFYFLILLLLLVVFFLGVETRGSIRWIPLGPIKLQPSEFAKPVLILFLAHFWSNKFVSWKNILKSFAIVLPYGALILKQPDLGTAVTIFFIWLLMLIGANVSAVKILIMGVLAAVIAPLSWLLLHDYQKNRIIGFLSPQNDPLGIGYNVIQAMIAVGSGEILGRGLGHGTQSRLQFLPEFRTDFIFASIAEEFGFIGSLTVLVLYGLLIIRGFQVLGKIDDKFSILLIFGVLGMLFFQVVVNVGMNVGIVPVTGITLPLVSYGGSSVIATFICLSFVSSVALRSNRLISEGQWLTSERD